MRETIWDFLFNEGYMPHGYCLLWQTELFWTHAIADMVIAASYFSIPAVLLVFALRRTDFRYRWVLVLFGVFIVGCGITHVFSMITLWIPVYNLEALGKVFTALASALTAVLLWPLLPKVLALPSTAQLESTNRALVDEGRERARVQQALETLNRELERRVAARTEALAEATRRAEDANAAKSRFLAAMSHELRTPLNAILGFAQLLCAQKAPPLADGHRPYVQDIISAGDHLHALIEDLLDLAKIDNGELRLAMESVDVGQSLDAVRSSLSGMAADSGVSLEISHAATPLSVSADPVRLRQILINLGSNAIKFGRPGGRARITAEQCGAAVTFTVEDDGLGIAKDKLDRLFAPFDRLGREAGPIEGTGIGLCISKRLAEMMDGWLTLDSQENVGTQVRLVLPAADAHLAVAAPAPRELDRVVELRPGLRLLYIEDNQSNLKMMAHFADTLPGVRMLTARDGAAGLRLARELAPHAILLDINLPGADGYEVLARLRADAETAGIPVIAVTAAAGAADRLRGMAAGFAAYLTKPLDLAVLRRLIGEIASASPAAPASR